jgi:multidrug efflux pump subunit AcrA (membrane-fusion protein)
VGAKIYHGTVSNISAVAEKKQVGNSTETVLTVEIKCGDDAPFKVGYNVDVTITTRTIEDTVVVPLMSTIDETDGENYVYIMRDDYSVEKRKIDLGEYSGIYVEAGGVAEGEKIILNPSAQIEEGVFVKPLAYQTIES